VLWLGVASGLNDISSEMVFVVFPLFLIETLKAGPAALGVIEALAVSAPQLLMFASGWLADRTGRRKSLALSGYSFSALAKFAIAFAAVWQQALAGRVADRIGKGVRTAPRDALIAESVAPKRRGFAFGIHRTLDTAGAVLGPLVAYAMLKSAPSDFRRIFMWSIVPAALAVFVVATFVQEVKPKRHADGLPRPKERVLSPALVAFLIATGVFSVGKFGDAFLILRAKDLGLAVTTVPLWYMVVQIIYTPLCVPVGLLCDRMPKGLVLAFGYFVFSGVYLGLSLAQGTAVLWYIVAGYAVHLAVTEVAGRALIAGLAAESARATALGLYHTITGAGALLASLLAGFLWQTRSASFAFGFGAAMALAGALGVVWVSARYRT
jgi:MFS family permease